MHTFSTVAVSPAPRIVHVLALLTTLATFPLIFMGGLVTSKGVGMAVPDWPNTFGYNMFLFPPSQWIGGVFYEHTHRLLGSLVGLLAIALLIATLVTRTRPRLRWLAVAVLVGVIIQGVLGGLRVVFNEIDFAVVHACVAQAFFCLAALMALMSSRRWAQAPTPPEDEQTARGRRLFGHAVGTVAVIFLQLVMGALMRHYQAGLAIPDFPLNYGRLTPPADGAGLERANEWREELQLPPVTLSQIWLHFFHRLGAAAVLAAGLPLSIIILRRLENNDWLIWPARWLVGLLVIQVGLGILTVLWRKPADIATGHVAVGALVLLAAFVLAARLWRSYAPYPAIGHTPIGEAA